MVREPAKLKIPPGERGSCDQIARSNQSELLQLNFIAETVFLCISPNLGRAIRNTQYARQPGQYVNMSIRSTLVCQYALSFRGAYGPDLTQASSAGLSQVTVTKRNGSETKKSVAKKKRKNCPTSTNLLPLLLCSFLRIHVVEVCVFY